MYLAGKKLRLLIIAMKTALMSLIILSSITLSMKYFMKFFMIELIYKIKCEDCQANYIEYVNQDQCTK